VVAENFTLLGRKTDFENENSQGKLSVRAGESFSGNSGLSDDQSY